VKEFDNYQPEIPQPFSTVIDFEGGAVVTTTDCYLGHYPLEAIKKHYGHDVRVEYFRGEFGELKGKPMVRVSWGAVEPKLTMDIKE
jgi:hypothetical protein